MYLYKYLDYAGRLPPIFAFVLMIALWPIIILREAWCLVRCMFLYLLGHKHKWIERERSRGKVPPIRRCSICGSIEALQQSIEFCDNFIWSQNEWFNSYITSIRYQSLQADIFKNNIVYDNHCDELGDLDELERLGIMFKIITSLVAVIAIAPVVFAYLQL